MDPQEKVHKLRIKIKKLRALARLLNQNKIQHQLRDLGRLLSDFRDQTIRQKWLKVHKISSPARAISNIQTKDIQAKIRPLETKLTHIKTSPASLQANLKRSQQKVERAQNHAAKSGKSQDFHQWRKRAKDLFYQRQFMGSPNNKELNKLLKVLGEAQDNIVVEKWFQAHPQTNAKKIIDLAHKEEKKAQRQALKFGRQNL